VDATLAPLILSMLGQSRDSVEGLEATRAGHCLFAMCRSLLKMVSQSAGIGEPLSARQLALANARSICSVLGGHSLAS
jgi:hypothetical protein